MRSEPFLELLGPDYDVKIRTMREISKVILDTLQNIAKDFDTVMKKLNLSATLDFTGYQLFNLIVTNEGSKTILIYFRIKDNGIFQLTNDKDYETLLFPSPEAICLKVAKLLNDPMTQEKICNLLAGTK